MRRNDFPVKNVYLDSACMSLRPHQVIAKIQEYYEEYPACSGRSAHSMSTKASEELGKAREKVAGFIDAPKENLVFTSGTTESINTVAKGLEFGNVYISDREHNSNLVPWQRTDAELNVVSTEDGFDLAKLDSELEENDIVSVVHVSNLDAYENPIEEIVKVARENNAYSMIDAAQSIPHRPFSAGDADFVAFSGHKMLGPSGTGGLYVSDRVKDGLEPLTEGGGAVTDSTYTSAEFKAFPGRMEAGLPNLAGFIGLGAAVDYLEDIGMPRVHEHEKKLTEKMRKGLENIENVETISRGPGIVSFRVEGMDPHQVAILLDEKDIAVRSGMHCVHSWFNARGEEPLVRASLHLYNDESDIEKLVEAVEEIAYLV
ncbi:MAG: aminotransferase class V-fold PLP-dependent enzyme, partial [Candidatus Nanohaloarchaea archaeon]